MINTITSKYLNIFFYEIHRENLFQVFNKLQALCLGCVHIVFTI